ncbi:fam-l protein [Plasmodium malariae]|uniref:Fam-l protein n=1 Tax=Plasmodium malariae TaxID=5858 RepID=A0A1D3TDM7_PLAMA|nr:fam-l protein [Plasmodium malariae]SCP03023.1 fam-l protein [Plasmodium malariae]
MEQKFSLLLFIKICTSIILSWICNFYHAMSTFNKYMDVIYNIREHKNTRTYRLLAECKQDHVSHITGLKQLIPNNKYMENKKICYNEKKNKRKYEKLDESSLINAGYHNQSKKNKLYIFETKTYSHLEKKIFKELDYLDFLKDNKTISDRVYKKTIFEKHKLRVFIPVTLLLLFSTYFILDLFFNCGLKSALFKLLKHFLGRAPLDHLYTYLKNNVGSFFSITINEGIKAKVLHITPFFYFVIYFTLFFILGITLILGVIYYHKKVKKYQKIKYQKR